MFTTENEFNAAVAQAKAAAAAYYDTDTLTMSDADYDQLTDKIAATLTAHPDWNDDGVITKVAAGASAGGTLTHPQPMLSLDKTTDLDQIAAFTERVPGDVVVELKLDGNAVRATYENGILTTLATRGDGVTGEPLNAALTIDGLPAIIDAPGTVTVTGEVYMTDTDFHRSNTNRMAAGKPGFANPRNGAAGVLRRETATFEAYLSFAAYHGTGADLDNENDYQQRMTQLGELGIRTVMALQQSLGLATAPVAPTQAVALINNMHTQRGTLGVGIDGAVIKAASYQLRERMGQNGRAPKWALAYKYPPLEATTFLDRIDVSVGRTGRMSLTAILNPPVPLDGSVVGRATLHNQKFVTDQKLGIGSRCLIVKRGDIIPYCSLAIGEQPEAVVAWVPPTVCPDCEQPWDTSEVLWRCETPECSTVGRITYAASRDVLDISGLGEEVATALVEAGLVSDVSDLFTLSVDDIASTQIGVTSTGSPRLIGEATATKIVASIANAKTAPLNRVVCSLGIRKMGRTMSRRLANHFGSLAAMRAATAEDMAAVEGVADGKATYYVAGFAAMSDVIDRLEEYGVTTTSAVLDTDTAEDGQLLLAGNVYVVSGSVPGYTRTTINERIEALGGKASSSVSASTTALVTAETGTSKAKKAAQLNIPVIDPAEFAAMIA